MYIGMALFFITRLNAKMTTLLQLIIFALSLIIYNIMVNDHHGGIYKIIIIRLYSIYIITIERSIKYEYS